MKKAINIILIFILFTTLFSAGLFFNNKEAKAGYTSAFADAGALATKVVGSGTPGIPTKDIGAILFEILKGIWEGIKESYQAAGDIAYKNSLRYFLNKVAYDTATHIATGSPGQKPLFITDLPKYLEQTKDEALGDFFYRLGKDVWGKDLCQPLDPLIKIHLEVSAKKAFAPKKVKCTWEDIKKNIGDLRNMKFDQLVQFSSHFNPSGNQLGAYLTLRTGGIEEKIRIEKEKTLERIMEGSFKSVVNPITGVIKTPAKIVDNAINIAFQESFGPSKVYTGNPVADAIGTFTNTLVSKYLERIFKKGFNPLEGGVIVSDFWTIGGTAGARLFFNELAEVNYSFGGTKSIDAIRSGGQFVDFVDDKFVQAINLNCTVGQATGFYKQGDNTYREECNNLISGTAKFGYDEDANEVSGRRGLSVRSMLVLRKFRVIPVGWELAAEYYRNFKIAGNRSENVERLNLNSLMKLYNDDTSPYYHLVDPDWLLKMPLTRCAKQGAGPEKIESEPYCLSQVADGEACPSEDLVYPFQRLDYCADYESCLDDRNGQCDTNDWGYCVEEKPVWSIAGTSCKNARQYSSCQALENTQDNSINYYLLNTVNSANFSAGVCDDFNSGCREYLEPITNNKIYLTSETISADCDARYEGCHLFYVDEYNTPEYYKLAPDYYNCRTDNPDERCNDFIKHCTINDMDCKFYTPISTQDPAVPAVISEDDKCPASCVGYKNYHQMKTQFELADDVDFIAKTGTPCSQPGCDEFTNLDKVAKGGEGIEYYSYLRQCIKPDEPGWDTYYTWQGSDTTGYQLRKWELKAEASGRPKGDSCSDLTEADCREFFDQELNSYKIYYSTTIIVSEDCHPFRRSLDNEIYQAIPKESIKCSKDNNMCREYKSNRGYNYQKIIESYFKHKEDFDNWTNDAEISTESVIRDDYSLKIYGTAQRDLILGDLEQDKDYVLEFLAKGSGSFEAGFTADVQGTLNQITLTDDNRWHYYRMQMPLNVEDQKLIITANAFVDNIVLKKTESVLLIKDSWKTPEECEVPPDGTARETMINCEAYQDRDNNLINLRNFSKLCSEDVVGCQLATDGDTNIQDYYVLNDEFKCSKENRGCTALGLITPNRNNESEYSLENVYRKINPDNTAYEICELNETFCQEYEYEQNKYYFKDPKPMQKICEFKHLAGEQFFKWYKLGTDEECPEFSSSVYFEKGYCLGGKSLEKNNSCDKNEDCTNLAYPEQDGLCTNWIGQCNSLSSGCREFQDPQEPIDCDPDNRNFELNKKQGEICNYYYYKDFSKCGDGSVNPGQGCVGFFETTPNAPESNIRSFKVCDNNLSIICEDDIECGGGKCVYTNTQTPAKK